MNTKQFFNKAFKTELKTSLKRLKPAFGLLVLCNSIFTIVYLWIVSSGRGFKDPTMSWLPYVDITEIVTVLAASVVLYCVFGFFIVMDFFHYLHNKLDLDLYHAVPISRKQLLVSKFTAISAVLAGSTIAQILLLVISKTILSTFHITFNFGQVLLCLLSALVTAIAVISVFVLCAVSTQRMFNYIVYSVALTVLLPFAFILLVRLPQQTIAGFYISESIVGYFIPAGNLGLVASGKGNHLIQLLSMSIVSVVVLWVSAAIYKRTVREDMYHSRFEKLPIRLTQIGVNLFGVAFISFLMEMILLGGSLGVKFFREAPILAIVILAPFSIMVNIFLEFILTKKRNFKAVVFQWIIVLGLTCGAMLALQGGVFGEEGYVPKLAEVESVTFTDNEYSGKSKSKTALAYEKLDKQVKHYGSYFIDSPQQKQGVELNLPESIESVIKLHNESLSFFHGEKTRAFGPTYSVTYNLKNGKKVKRTLQYSTSVTRTADEDAKFSYDYKAENRLTECYRQVTNQKEYLEKSELVFDDRSNDLVGMYDYSDRSDDAIITDKKFIKLFLETYKKDYNNDKIKSFKEELSGKNSFSNNSIGAQSKSFNIWYKKSDLSIDLTALDKQKITLLPSLYSFGNGNNQLLEGSTITVPNSYKETLALLSKYGYSNELVELETITGKENLSCYFIPVNKYNYEKYRIGKWVEILAEELSDTLMEYNYWIINNWKTKNDWVMENWSVENNQENIASIISKIDDVSLNGQLEKFKSSEKGYFVTFTAPNGGDEYQYVTNVYFISVDDRIEGWSMPEDFN